MKYNRYGWSSFDRLETICDIETGEALRFSYNESHKVTMVEYGRGEETSSTPCGCDVCSSTGDAPSAVLNFVAERATYIGYKNDILLYKGSNEAIVSSDDVNISHFFNRFGELMLCMEKTSDGYKHLGKIPGESLPLAAGGTPMPENINTRPTHYFNTNADVTNFNSAKKTINDYIKDTTTSCSNYVVTFYLKLHNSNYQDLLQKATVTFSTVSAPNSFVVASAYYDACTLNAWQFVRIPIAIGSGNTLESLKLEVNNADFSVSDVRICAAPHTRLMLVNNSGTQTDIDDVSSLTYIAGGQTKSLVYGSKIFMTESDLLLTCISKFRNPGSFTLTHNNGRIQIGGVSSAYFTAGGSQFDIAPVSTNRAPYCVETTSKDGVVTTHDYNCIVLDGLGGTYNDVVQHYTAGPNSQIVAETNLAGQTTKVTDEYGVETKYSYDGYGNLETTTVKGTGGDEITSSVAPASYTYAGLLDTVTRGGVKHQYQYDAYGEELTAIEARDAGTNALLATHAFEHKPLGKGRELSCTVTTKDQNGAAYNTYKTIVVPATGETAYAYEDKRTNHPYGMYNSAILMKIAPQKCMVSIAEKPTTESLNKYGLTTKVEKPSLTTYGFSRQWPAGDSADTLWESPFCHPVTRISGGGEEYNFVYDDEARLTKYSQSGNTLEVEMNGSTYECKAWGRPTNTTVAYDSAKTFNPRIASTTRNSSNLNMTHYTYDQFGGLKTKSGSVLGEILNNDTNAKELSREIYGPFATQPSTPTHKSIADYAGDKINSVQNSFQYAGYTGSYTVGYTYDAFGRIKTETHGKFGTTKSFTYNPDGTIETGLSVTGIMYDIYGFISYKNNGADPFAWTNNHLTGHKNVSNTYDFFGRRKSKTYGGVTTDFAWDGGKLVAETSGSGYNAPVTSYFYDLEGVCRIESGNEWCELGRDALGNVSIVSTKKLYPDDVFHIAYDFKGSFKVYNSQGTDVTSGTAHRICPFLWKGYYYDYDMGLYW
ncbi:MAG: hypothetical protein FWE62_03275, partial [Firmicutes bacterium]|nr:hypothetical protein [Bacillota bacterium]